MIDTDTISMAVDIILVLAGIICFTYIVAFSVSLFLRRD